MIKKGEKCSPGVNSTYPRAAQNVSTAEVAVYWNKRTRWITSFALCEYTLHELLRVRLRMILYPGSRAWLENARRRGPTQKNACHSFLNHLWHRPCKSRFAASRRLCSQCGKMWRNDPFLNKAGNCYYALYCGHLNTATLRLFTIIADERKLQTYRALLVCSWRLFRKCIWQYPKVLHILCMLALLQGFLVSYYYNVFVKTTACFMLYLQCKISTTQNPKKSTDVAP